MLDHYRHDIDGLRAVAVIPVLLFHAGVAGFEGGFVGVDIFFVISGYLITAIIAREIADNTFSLVGFYERRVRRIFPALAVMMLFVLLAAALTYLPSDFASVPRSIIAALLFVANLFFWFSSGYFDSSAAVKPMLHTWSLAVEEQFYVFFPLLLIAMARFSNRRRSIIIWIIAFLSLAASILLTKNMPSFAFYMIVTRAWELIAGALLALGAIPAIKNKMLREAVSFLGLSAIAFSIFTFNEDLPFPGALALIPVCGATALLHSAPGTVVGRLISLRLPVGVGLISYSLYLWHWPIIVFTRYQFEGKLPSSATIGIIIASFICAMLSWRFVERPFRSKVRFSRAKIFRAAALMSVAIAFLATSASLSKGWPSRFSPQVVALDSESKAFSPFRKRCHRSDDETAATRKPPCTLGAEVPPSILVWGDSHGVELSFTLSEKLKSVNKSLVEETSSSCAPVLGLGGQTIRRCSEQNDAVIKYVRQNPNLKTIVLAGFWASSDNRNRSRLPTALIETVQTLRSLGRDVIVVGAVPNQSFNVPRHLALLALHGKSDQAFGTSRSEILERTKYILPAFTKINEMGVPIVDPTLALCNKNGDCKISHDGHSLYFDNHHLSVEGSRLVTDLVWPHLNNYN